MIVRVEQAMGFVTVGRIFEVFLVNFSHGLVVSRIADLKVAVVTIEAGSTHRNDLVGLEREGLSAPIDATTGAGHDFDNMILFFAGSDILADFFDICQPEDLAKTELDACNFDLGLTDAFAATEDFEVEIF